MRRLLLIFLALAVVVAACSGNAKHGLELRTLPKPPIALTRSPAIAGDGDAVILLAERTVLRLDAFNPGATWQRIVDDVPAPAGAVAAWQGRLWYATAEGGRPQLVNVALTGDPRVERRGLDGLDSTRYDLVAGLSALWLVSGTNAWRIETNATLQPLHAPKATALHALGELPDGSFLALAPDERQVLAWTAPNAWQPTSLDPQLVTSGARQTNNGLLTLAPDGYTTITTGPKFNTTRVATSKNCPVADFFATDLGTVLQGCELLVRDGAKTKRVALPNGTLVAFAGPRGRPVYVRDGQELLLLS